MVEKLQKALDCVDFHLRKQQDGLLAPSLHQVEDEVRLAAEDGGLYVQWDMNTCREELLVNGGDQQDRDIYIS